MWMLKGMSNQARGIVLFLEYTKFTNVSCKELNFPK